MAGIGCSCLQEARGLPLGAFQGGRSVKVVSLCSQGHLTLQPARECYFEYHRRCLGPVGQQERAGWDLLKHSHACTSSSPFVSHRVQLDSGAGDMAMGAAMTDECAAALLVL